MTPLTLAVVITFVGMVFLFFASNGKDKKAKDKLKDSEDEIKDLKASKASYEEQLKSASETIDICKSQIKSLNDNLEIEREKVDREMKRTDDAEQTSKGIAAITASSTCYSEGKIKELEKIIEAQKQIISEVYDKAERAGYNLRMLPPSYPSSDNTPSKE